MRTTWLTLQAVSVGPSSLMVDMTVVNTVLPSMRRVAAGLAPTAHAARCSRYGSSEKREIKPNPTPMPES
jgi:hypothetical protein